MTYFLRASADKITLTTAEDYQYQHKEQHMKSVKGTKTEKNLLGAFAGEWAADAPRARASRESAGR